MSHRDLDTGAVPRVPATAEEERGMAMLAVACHAVDAEDCLLLLRALGLVADPEAKPGRRSRGRVA